jgi:predicted DNA-binding transcriptional regulator AlpA
MSTKRYLRPGPAAKKCGVSVCTLYRYARQDASFPRPIKLSLRSTVFDEQEIDIWVQSKRPDARTNAYAEHAAKLAPLGLRLEPSGGGFLVVQLDGSHTLTDAQHAALKDVK